MFSSRFACLSLLKRGRRCCQLQKDSKKKKMAYPSTIKCVVIGDPDAGKTSLLSKFAQISGEPYEPEWGEFAWAYAGQKCIFVDADHMAPISPISNASVASSTSSARSSPDENHRPFESRSSSISGHDVHAFILCVSLANPSSVEDTVTRILETVAEHIGSIPFVLVGTQIDRRVAALPDYQGSQSEIHPVQNTVPYSYAKAERFAKKIGACTYMECSATTGEGVDEVFEEAFGVALRFARERTRNERLKSVAARTLEQEGQRKPSCITQ